MMPEMQALGHTASSDCVCVGGGALPLASVEDSSHITGTRPSVCPERKLKLQIQGIWGLGPR